MNFLSHESKAAFDRVEEEVRVMEPGWAKKSCRQMLEDVCKMEYFVFYEQCTLSFNFGNTNYIILFLPQC